MERLIVHNSDETIEFKLGDKVRIKEGVPYFSPRERLIIDIVLPDKMIDANNGRIRLGLSAPEGGIGGGMAYLPENVELVKE